MAAQYGPEPVLSQLCPLIRAYIIAHIRDRTRALPSDNGWHRSLIGALCRAFGPRPPALSSAFGVARLGRRVDAQQRVFNQLILDQRTKVSPRPRPRPRCRANP